MIKKRTFRGFFKNGIGVYAGQVAETKPHNHHATEIIFGLTGRFTLADSKNQQKEYYTALIPHNIKHNLSMICKSYLYLSTWIHSITWHSNLVNLSTYKMKLFM